MSRRLLFPLCPLLAIACGVPEGIDPVTQEGVETVSRSLIVDDLYAKLREAEGLLPMPAPSEEVEMGTFNCSTGQFSGRVTTILLGADRKPYRLPPVEGLDAVRALLTFRANCYGLVVTAGGVTASSPSNVVTVDVGTHARPTWTLQAAGRTISDEIILDRTRVRGVGAFTLAALPISIVYEPPMNAALTNRAHLGFRQEMSTITTVSKSNSTQTTRPRWVAKQALATIINRLATVHPAGTAAANFFGGAQALLGNFDGTTTTGTTVNSDSTLGMTQVTSTTISTNARLGPGRGDVMVFYKNAKVAWAMEQGQVSLMLLDHGALAMVTVDNLRADLAAVMAGQTAPVTGLDAVSLTGLLNANPSATQSLKGSGGLPSPRFRLESTLLLNGTTFNNSIAHTVTQVEKTATVNTTTNVLNTHAGWLSVIGIGLDDATTTTTVSMGTSRTDQVSTTVSAAFELAAAANESYSVEVYYDAVFGTFLTRRPVTLFPFSLDK